jgi:DNA repair exonuclease SbcCD ATPase subunit
VRDGDFVMSGRLTDGTEASSSCAVLPASDGTAARPEQERECSITPPAHFDDAQAKQELWQEFRDHGASLNRALNEALRIHSGPAWRVFQVRSCSLSLAILPLLFFYVCAFPDQLPLVSIRQRQELEDRARERYGALDQMSSELRRLHEQRDALDALVEALRTGDGWLAYRVKALRDQLLELEAQVAEGTSAVEEVRTALVDRDEALRRAREDLARAHTLAAEWETEVASVRAQLRRDCTTLEEARTWQCQAEEKAKEAEELRTRVSEKAACLASVEE